MDDHVILGVMIPLNSIMFALLTREIRQNRKEIEQNRKDVHENRSRIDYIAQHIARQEGFREGVEYARTHSESHTESAEKSHAQTCIDIRTPTHELVQRIGVALMVESVMMGYTRLTLQIFLKYTPLCPSHRAAHFKGASKNSRKYDRI